MFTIRKLAHKICDAPGFPEDQSPSLISRDVDAYQVIVLAPLPVEGNSTHSEVSETPRPNSSYLGELDDERARHEEMPPAHSLSLTFHFKKKQNGASLYKLADHLNKFMKTDDGEHLNEVQWAGIWSGSRLHPRQRIREAVLKVMAQSPLRLRNTMADSVNLEVHQLSADNEYTSTTSARTPPRSTENTPPLGGDIRSMNPEEGNAKRELEDDTSFTFEGSGTLKRRRHSSSKMTA